MPHFLRIFPSFYSPLYNQLHGQTIDVQTFFIPRITMKTHLCHKYFLMTSNQRDEVEIEVEMFDFQKIKIKKLKITISQVWIFFRCSSCRRFESHFSFGKYWSTRMSLTFITFPKKNFILKSDKKFNDEAQILFHFLTKFEIPDQYFDNEILWDFVILEPRELLTRSSEPDGSSRSNVHFLFQLLKAIFHRN